jgi:hypothetical protein
LSAFSERPMSIWETRTPTPVVPVVPGFSALFVHAALRTTASVKARIEVSNSLVCIAFLLR